MAVDVDEYVDQFRPELMEYAADWCLGSRFIDIQQRSDFFEVMHKYATGLTFKAALGLHRLFYHG
jgi:hypothetical protein